MKRLAGAVGLVAMWILLTGLAGLESPPLPGPSSFSKNLLPPEMIRKPLPQNKPLPSLRDELRASLEAHLLLATSA